MSNVITIYKTNLNRENRMIDKTNLNNYLSTCTNVSLDTTYPIMPNVPFVIDINNVAELNIYQYNYLKYTYANNSYYSFIDSIDFLANEGIVRINHTTDYWIMLDSIESVQGTLTRGLLNDYVKGTAGSNYIPNFDNTLNVPEVQFNNANLLYNRYRPCPLQNKYSNYSQYWLYIYFANPYQVSSVNFNTQVSLNGVPNLGITLCYPIKQFGTKYYLYYMTGNFLSSGLPEYDSYELFNLTNSAITSMVISPIPPKNEDLYSYISVDNIYFYPPVDYNYDGEGVEEADGTVIADFLDTVEGLPPKMNFVYEMQMFDCNAYVFVNGSGGQLGAEEITDYIRLQRRYAFTDTADNYLNYQPKALSPIYNPLYIEDNALSYQQLPTSANNFFISVGISADLTCYAYYECVLTATNFAKMHRKQITSSFSPTVLLDYWTRLNASIESISARGTKTKAVLNGITSTLNAVVGTGASIATGVLTAGVATGARAAIAGTVAGIQGVSSGVSGASNIAGSITDSYYSYQIADRQQEIADYQYNTGNTDETAALYLSGIFDFSDLPTIYSILQPTENINHISRQLATKGENCNLDFNLYWNNHSHRTNYEYFEMTNVTVIGCNAQMQRAVQEMLAHGVRLWYYNSDTEIGNVYSVSNYPTDIL